MGMYYTFSVECLQDGRWDVPGPLRRPTSPGAFTSFRQGSCELGLFFSWFGKTCPSKPLLELEYGPPPDWEHSLLFQWLFEPDSHPSSQEIDWRPYAIHWTPYEALFVDAWDVERVCVKGTIEAAHAHWFTDGRQSFPRQREFREAIQGSEWDRSWQLAEHPIDRGHGRGRWEIDHPPPDGRLDVTWMATIAELLGEEEVTAFKDLRRFGTDAALRVVVHYS
jgi:hypothetical protein